MSRENDIKALRELKNDLNYAERMRKDAAAAAADAAATQARVASDISAIYRNEYYNS